MNSRACLRSFCVLCVLCGPALTFALDREAFSIRKYDLTAQLDPAQHRIGVRGSITLRNDSASPQKIALLQISSSLDWRAIKAADKSLQFVTQPYTSDIDHTGALSEAIVTLPQAVPPGGSLDLTVGYEGVIVQDATRLTRIGTPEAAAQNSDWDRIDPTFAAVRGAGYVAWYPITTEVANLSEGDDLFQVLERWKSRERGATMNVVLEYPGWSGDSAQPSILCDGNHSAETSAVPPKYPSARCFDIALDRSIPSFGLANYGVVKRDSVTVYNLATHAAAAEIYADNAEKAASLVKDWFGPLRERAQTADLAGPDSTPFESGAFLLTPLGKLGALQAGLSAAHQLTHAAFISPRPWIDEGLAHFAQSLYLEQQSGRKKAIDYMGAHRATLVRSALTVASSDDEKQRSLVSTIDESLYRSKAMYVWWMLRDMVGEPALKKALAAYRPEQDKEPSYMPHLIAAQTQRDLEWFFDDWVYRDRGLPEFKVESAFSRKTMTGSFMLTITIDNLGTAGAEVPLFIKFAGGEAMKRLEVRAKDKATIRVETPAAPQEVVVNDGSVPEVDTTNDSYKVGPAQN